MDAPYKRIITGALFGSIFLGSLLWFPLLFTGILSAILVAILVVEWPKFFPVKSITFWCITPLYPVAPFLFLIHMSMMPAYHHVLLAFFILIFTFDTISYAGGKLLGRHKIIPRISPGKTWEGLVCGLVATVCVLWVVLRFYGHEHSLIFTIFSGISVGLLAFIGDLFESGLKRRAQIKDSGMLLPGHGGFLDRFDSVLFVAYFLYVTRDFWRVLL